MKKSVLFLILIIFFNGVELFSVDDSKKAYNFPWIYAGAGMQLSTGNPRIASENFDGVFSLTEAESYATAGFFLETVLVPHFSTALFFYPFNTVYSNDGTFGSEEYEYSASTMVLGFQGKVFANKDCIGPFAGVSFNAIGPNTTQSGLSGSNFDDLVQELYYSSYSIEIGNRLYIGSPFIIFDLYGSYVPEKELVAIGLSLGIGLSNNQPTLFN